MCSNDADRATALKERYFSTVNEFKDVLHTEDDWKLPLILQELEEMKVEIEYITRM